MGLTNELVPAGSPFGQALREARQARHLSQASVSHRTGCDHSYIQRLEAGTRQPTRVMVEEIARALRLSEPEQNALLVAAGFAPRQREHLAIGPLYGRLASAIDQTTPELKRWAEQTVLGLIEALERAPHES